MNFVRKIANSDVLADIIDIPKELRNKKKLKLLYYLMKIQIV